MKRMDALPARLRPLEPPTWLAENAWPFDSHGLEVDDSVIAVSEAGHGPVLFFVHVGTWSFIWRELVMRLAHDFRCVFFDAPGTGQSRDGRSGGASLARASRVTAAVIDAFDLRAFTLVAH